MTKELLMFLTETQGIYIDSSMYHFNYVMPKVMVTFSTLFSLSGFQIREVAHDFVLQLKTWILSKGMLNSFDSWHGTHPFFSYGHCYRFVLFSNTYH